MAIVAGAYPAVCVIAAVAPFDLLLCQGYSGVCRSMPKG